VSAHTPKPPPNHLLQRERAVEAWYFSEASKKLRFDDRRDIAIGVTHTAEGKLELCQRGLHASVKAFDALSYAPGNIVWRVRLGGEILEGDDKLCARERTYIAGGVEAEETLRKFSRRVALDVIHLWDAPEVVRQYLETGDGSLRAAAWAAARDAPRDAAWAAARAAAWDAAWDAARDAAWAAAWAAARDAARDAAWAAARDAAFEKYNGWLEEMLRELVEAA